MTGRGFLIACGAVLFLFSEAFAQPANQALEQFKANHPGARFYGSQFYQPSSSSDEGRGGMTAVYGTILALGETAEQSAWNHLNQMRNALGTEIGDLVPEIKEAGDVVQGVMWDAARQSHKFQVLRFNQFLNGIPVFRSGVGFLVRNQEGYPLVMSGFTVKDLTGNRIMAPAGPDKPVVSGTMIANVARLMDGAPVERSVLIGKQRRRTPLAVETSEEQYVVFAGVDGEFAVPELAISFIATRGSIDTLPDYHKYLVVASVGSGEILHQETQICHCSTCVSNMVNIQGTVDGRATQGLNALECDPEQAVPLPYAEVSVSGGNTVFADENGNFNIPHGGSTNVTVTSRLRGRFFEVRDESNNGAIPSISQTVTPPGPVGFLHNPVNNNELLTANVNAYVESNVVRDFVLNFEPNFPVIANQTSFDVNTNINSSCNAFYDGSSINFYRNGGGCNNTAFSDVVYHEYGHHLINVTNNGQGQMGEGSGDSIGVLIQDEPILGQGFSNCGSGIRTANNNKQYPCSGGIHDCGQLISGCVWDTRNQLVSTEPNDYINISSQLFLGMLIVRGQMDPGQSTIAPDITVIYLELDDDDGNISNGTPHYDEIAAGFGAHNMDAPPLALVEFQYPNGRPELIPHNGGVAFEVEVLPVAGNPQPGTGVLHVDKRDGNGFQPYPMSQSTPNVYQAVFPSIECGTVVRYYVSANPVSGATQLDPRDAPNTSFSGLAADSVDSVFYDNAQVNLGWTVSGNASDGQWDRGVPVGGGDRGDPATDGDGSGACWLTDNVDGNSDVDGGSTLLTSPILDASHASNQVPLIRYQRFYDNASGNAPQSDVFVVEISNNGGGSWVNLETVGPTGAEVQGGWYEKTFRISDFLTPTSNMRLRFIASDFGDGSVVEAAVDAVEVLLATCEAPVNPFGNKLLDGLASGGALSDAYVSDDTDWQLDPSPTGNPSKQIIDMILLGETDIEMPNSFSFRVEASMLGGPAGDVIQTIELWDNANNQWVVVDSRAATIVDSVVEAAGTGNLSNFVQPQTGEIIARVSWSSPSFSGAPFDWSIDLDQAVWLID